MSVPQRIIVTACTVHGCGRQHAAHGLCYAHAMRLRRGVELEAPIRNRRPNYRGVLCSFAGCGRAAKSAGMCKLHYDRHLEGRPLDGNRDHLGQVFTCKHCGKQGKHGGKARKREFCNRDCWKAWKDRRVKSQRICRQCGKGYIRAPSQNKGFCSRECYDQSIRHPRPVCECGKQLELRHPTGTCITCTRWSGVPEGWRQCILKAKSALTSRIGRRIRSENAWMNRMAAAVASLRIRQRIPPSVNNRRRPPATWDGCIKSAWQSLKMRTARAGRDQWMRKCDTAARSLRRRALERSTSTKNLSRKTSGARLAAEH